jgi:hypothetical protein
MGGKDTCSFSPYNFMLKQAIQSPLTKAELRELMQFLSYHLGYVPFRLPKMAFCKTAKDFAERFEGYQVREKEEKIDEINRECGAFYDHPTETIVFQGFSYHEGVEIPRFIVPMSTVIHELIHFFQYATGTFGNYRIFYEGTNDLLSCFLVNDFSIDYKQEAKLAFNLIMEMSDHDFLRSLQWMKTFTLHSDKNRFVHRSLKQCPTFMRYNPKKFLEILDDEEKDPMGRIDNDAVRKVLTKYSLKIIVDMCKKYRTIIQV